MSVNNMKNILVLLAAAGMFVGCAHDRSNSQGSTSPDSGTVQGQGAAASDMQHNNASGGTAYQGGITPGNNSPSSTTTNSSSTTGTGNTDASGTRVK
jgi:hypothetical protein